MTNKKWAFIGASTIAREWMIDAVRAQGDDICAVMSSDKTRADAYAKENNIPRGYTNLDEMLRQEKPDAVYISTTNELHKQQTLAAAAAGAHILCEKPLALTLADAEEMVSACEAAGVQMATNHHLRAAASHEAIKQTITDGGIGTLNAARIYHAVYLPEHLQGWRLDKPQAGGGVILDITVHDADLMAYLLGAYPRTVTAMAQNAGMGKGVEDGAMSIWQYDSGALCYAHESFAVPHAMTGIELHGDKGSIFAKDVMTQRPAGSVHLHQKDTGWKEIPYTPRNLYQHALTHFCAAMNGKGRPLVDGKDGIRSLAVALAVMESAKTGKAVEVDYGRVGV